MSFASLSFKQCGMCMFSSKISATERETRSEMCDELVFIAFTKLDMTAVRNHVLKRVIIVPSELVKSKEVLFSNRLLSQWLSNIAMTSVTKSVSSHVSTAGCLVHCESL